MLADFSSLFQMGVAGIMLAWFLLWVTPELRAIRDAINRSARALLIITLELPDSSEAARREARAMLDELNGERRARNRHGAEGGRR